MIDKSKTLCFSGHRTEKLPKNTKELIKINQHIYNEICNSINCGYENFLFGACYGFDLICAEQVLLRKKIIKQIEPMRINLIAIVPFEEQAIRWNENNRNTYYEILSKCDEVITLNVHYRTDCYYERNRYMIDNSSKLICYYNGSDGGTKYTVKYAEKNSIPIVNLYEK